MTDEDQRKIKQVDDALAQKDKAVADQAKRVETVKPTPTQRENDLARLGVLDHDTKEDDGSPPEHETVARMVAARLPEGYETRDMKADERPKRKSP